MFGLGDKLKNLKDKTKEKAAEKMLERQLKKLPEDQRQMVMAMIEKNPDFFQNISNEIQEEIKNGKTELAASMKVMRKYQNELQKMMLESMGGDPRKSDRNLK